MNWFQREVVDPAEPDRSADRFVSVDPTSTPARRQLPANG
jgi:hypothetical protein